MSNGTKALISNRANDYRHVVVTRVLGRDWSPISKVSFLNNAAEVVVYLSDEAIESLYAAYQKEKKDSIIDQLIIAA